MIKKYKKPILTIKTIEGIKLLTMSGDIVENGPSANEIGSPSVSNIKQFSIWDDEEENE